MAGPTLARRAAAPLGARPRERHHAEHGAPPRAGSQMTCGALAAIAAGCDTAFTVDASRVTFGRGALAEAGDRARALGMRRAALFTDPRLRELPWFAEVR